MQKTKLRTPVVLREPPPPPKTYSIFMVTPLCASQPTPMGGHDTWRLKALKECFRLQRAPKLF